MDDSRYDIRDVDQSNIFKDFCHISDNDGSNDLSIVKAENFNLRLRCVYLDTELEKLRDNVQNNGSATIERLHQTNSNEIITENGRLKKENEFLNDKLKYFNRCEEKLSEVELKYRNEKLKNAAFDKQGNISEVCQELIKFNETVVAESMLDKQKISKLEEELKNLRHQEAKTNAQRRKSLNDSLRFQYNMVKDTNEVFNMSLSKQIITECHGCDLLKVNNDRLTEMINSQFTDREGLQSEVRNKDQKILEIEQEMASLKNLLDEKQQRYTKTKKILEKSFQSIVKRDEKIAEYENNRKEIVDFYSKQINDFNVEMGNISAILEKEIEEQNLIMVVIHDLLSTYYKNEAIYDHNNNISQLKKQIEKINVRDAKRQKVAMKKQWSLVSDAIKTICQHRKVEHRRIMNRSMDDINLSTIRDIQNKYFSVQEIAKHIFNASCHSQGSQKHSDNSLCSRKTDNFTSESDRYSSQYKISSSHSTRQSPLDLTSSFYYDNDSSNTSAYLSVINDGHSQMMDPVSGKVLECLESLFSRLQDLGIAIFKYGNIVIEARKDIPTSMIDKSCLAGSNEESRLINASVSGHMSFNENETLVQRITELEIKIESNLEELGKRDKLTQEKQEQIDSLKDHIESNELQIKKQSNKINNLSEIIKDYKNSLKEKDEKIVELKEDEEKLRVTSSNELVKKQGIIDCLENEKKFYQESIMSINELVEELKIKINQNEIVIQQMESDSLQSHGIITNLETELKNVHGLHDQVTNLLANNEIELQNLYQERDALLNSNGELSSQYEQMKHNYEQRTISLANMTQSLQILNVQRMDIVKKVAEIYKKISVEPIQDLDALFNNEALNMLDTIGVNLDKLSQLVPMHNSPLRYVFAEKNLDTNIQIPETLHMNDLTHITSLASDGSNSDIQAPVKSKRLDINVSGFRIKSLEDIANNPDKVLDMLKTLIKNMENLKRRLKMRYEENKELRRTMEMFTSTDKCMEAIKQLEEYTKECEINNENLESIVKRKSLK